VPAAVFERVAAQHAFAGEPRLGQGALLGQIADIGDGLDPVHLRVGEQVARQPPLGGGAPAPSSRLRHQRDPHGPAVGRASRLVPAPDDKPQSLLVDHGHQRAAVLTQQAGLGPAASPLAGVLPAVPLVPPGSRRVAGEPADQRQLASATGRRVNRRSVPGRSSGVPAAGLRALLVEAAGRAPRSSGIRVPRPPRADRVTVLDVREEQDADVLALEAGRAPREVGHSTRGWVMTLEDWRRSGICTRPTGCRSGRSRSVRRWEAFRWCRETTRASWTGRAPPTGGRG